MLLHKIVLFIATSAILFSANGQQQSVNGIPNQTVSMSFMSTLVSGQIAAGGTDWAPPVGSLNLSTTESTRVIGLPRTGTVSHFVACINVVGNSTGSLVYTFRLGTLAGVMADTAIVLTIPTSAAIGCYPEPHSFVYTAGQAVDLQIHSNATVGNAATTASVSFQLD